MSTVRPSAETFTQSCEGLGAETPSGSGTKGGEVVSGALFDFALFMAKNYGARVRSFNISKEQIAYSREWAKRLGLEGVAAARYVHARDVELSVELIELLKPIHLRSLGAPRKEHRS